MPNASRVTFDELDQTFSPADVPVGISAIIGKFKRGPINNPSDIISSWTQFQKIFGGLDQATDDALLTKRALERGSQLRVVNVRHYDDITNAGSLTAEKSTPATGKSSTLASALVTGNTYAITINASVISQVYTTSSDNTQSLLVTKIKQQLPGVVSNAIYLGSNKILITPVTGIDLVVTGQVTGGAAQPAVTIGSVATIANSAGTTLFSLSPKNEGEDGNNLQVTIQAASNGDVNSFDLIISHLLESDLREPYPNIKIIGQPTVDQSDYLNKIVLGSSLMDVTYSDLSAIGGNIRPVNTILKYDSGTDGDDITDADIIGASSSKIGVYSLDPYDDFFQVGSFNSNSVAVMQGLALYASNRQDTVAFVHIDNDNTTESAVATVRDNTLIDSTYVAFFAGGIKAIDPQTTQERPISELGDVMGAAAYSASKFGPWYSFAGKSRGTILNCLGVVNNFGLDSNYAGRNLLANHQVNLAIVKNGRTQLSGNFTGQLGNSTLSFLNVRRMLIYLKKILGPIFDQYVEEPNDPITWAELYTKVKPELKSLKDQRAIANWSYQGDQNVTNVNQCVINNVTDVQAGKYKVIIYVQSIVSLQEIQVVITLTDSGVSFEDSLSSLNQA